MLEPGKTRQCWPFRDRRQDQNRGIARSFAPKESKFAVLAQHLELVFGQLRHGDLVTASNWLGNCDARIRAAPLVPSLAPNIDPVLFRAQGLEASRKIANLCKTDRRLIVTPRILANSVWNQCFTSAMAGVALRRRLTAKAKTR